MLIIYPKEGPIKDWRIPLDVGFFIPYYTGGKIWNFGIYTIVIRKKQAGQ